MEQQRREQDAELAQMKDDIMQQLDARNAALSDKVDQLLSQGAASGVRIAAPSERPAGPAPAARGGGALGLAGGVPGVAVVGVGQPGDASGPAPLLYQALLDAARSSSEEPCWVNLLEAEGTPFEELDARLASARVAIVCPDIGDDDRRTILAERQGLKAVMASFPGRLSKVYMLSRIGAQSIKGGINMRSFFGLGYSGTFAGLEDELTSSARRRGRNAPLQVVVVRMGAMLERPLGGSAIRCLSGGEGDVRFGTSAAAAAEALLQAVVQGVNTTFSVVEDPSLSRPAAAVAARWEELLLPFIGPEVWRTEVSDARRSAIFVHQWAEEWFNHTEEQGSARCGLKTPVQFERTPTGVIFKFRPLGTPSGRQFADLDEGGLELVAEEPAGSPPRLRARRCAYGFKVISKENSERVLLQKFKDDWASARS